MTTDNEPNPYEAPPTTIETSAVKPGMPMSYLLAVSICFIVVAVGLALIGMSGLAVFLIGALVPVSLRTVAAAKKRQADGRTFDWADYVAAFLASFGIFALCLVVGSATFCCTCLATVLSASLISDDNYGVLIILASISAIVGIVIGIRMFSRYWPRG